LDEVVVVDTPEALLVMSKAAAQDVKKVVSKLETACDRPESMASSVGGGTVIDSGAGFDVSRIELDTGESLSRIADADRNEHWVVVSGTGRATMSGQSIPLVAGETIRLEAGGPIQLENQGEMPLTLIFVAVES
jgi:mannose-6-phosphate isomerase-like protein (cupin superfamily)